MCRNTPLPPQLRQCAAGAIQRGDAVRRPAPQALAGGPLGWVIRPVQADPNNRTLQTGLIGEDRGN